MNCKFLLTARHANLHAQFTPTCVFYWLEMTERLFLLSRQTEMVKHLNQLLFGIVLFLVDFN